MIGWSVDRGHPGLPFLLHEAHDFTKIRDLGLSGIFEGVL
jgi:hypothetical protein